jgi:hypothetical protein
MFFLAGGVQLALVDHDVERLGCRRRVHPRPR